MTLLTEIADYDEDGSWGRMSEGWPEITGDEADHMWSCIIKTNCIPYGSYVKMREKGRYGDTESMIRVHPDHIDHLEDSFRTSNNK